MINQFFFNLIKNRMFTVLVLSKSCKSLNNQFPWKILEVISRRNLSYFSINPVHNDTFLCVLKDYTFILIIHKVSVNFHQFLRKAKFR